ncbi:unnamed protein product [Scytosiphon promiscuus]
MRVFRTAVALCSGTAASARDYTGLATSRRELSTHVEAPAVRLGHASLAEAAANHDHDQREDVPVAGRQCIPSPLWATQVDPDSYEIGCKEIEELQGNSTLRGKGNVREVSIASYNGRSVAVKRLIHTRPLVLHEHWLEMAASDAVRGKPNVVDMLGFCNTTVVTEAYDMDVQRVAQHAKEPLPIEQVVSMSLDAAVGLQSLHEAADAPIVHSDVKIDQLLIREDGSVSLSDYNLAYFMGTYPDGNPCPFNNKGSSRVHSAIKSPEYIALEPMTEKVDIYRMGLVFAQIVSAGSSNKFVAKKGGTLSFDPTWNQGYVELVQDMLGEVDQRPAASELVSRLQAIREELPHTHA